MFKRRAPKYRRKPRRAFRWRRAFKRTKTISNRVMSFKRTTSGWTAITTNTSGGATFGVNANNVWSITSPALAGQTYAAVGFAFCLADLTDYVEFQNMFDCYKISGIAIKVFSFQSSSNTMTATSVGGLACLMHSAYDPDDNSAPTASVGGIANLQEYGSYRVTNLSSLTRPWKKFIRPRQIMSVNSNGAAALSASTRPMWLNCNDPNVRHFSYKFLFEMSQQQAVASTFNFRIETTYYLKMRNPI